MGRLRSVNLRRRQLCQRGSGALKRARRYLDKEKKRVGRVYQDTGQRTCIRVHPEHGKCSRALYGV